MTKKGAKGAGHPKRSSKSSAKTEGSMKMTMYTAPTMVPRSQVKERKQTKPPGGKRLALARNYLGKGRSMARRNLDPCDNSNDSGLGFDHHLDPHTVGMTERLNWTDERAQAKRPKLDIKVENDEVNDNYTFPERTYNYRDNNTAIIRTAPSVALSTINVTNTQPTTSEGAVPRCMPVSNRSAPPTPATLITQLQARSRYMDISLSILYQPEQQHRARYQTEGSRGAVKDRSGNGFPVVQLTGYNKPATLQVFIGTDVGKVAPHMFYQACRVSGKNSTPCMEKKIDGTIVIEVQLEPSKEMVATCDCVGILKERNVDVEHRFPDQLASRSKKKSTRCRMVFRTTITHTDGIQETLQVCSQPIVCTQPPGIPEISKKSLTSCPAGGGLELFIIGKNFLKDTLVYFQSEDDPRVRWEQSVVPDKEFLQQTHLVCVVPPYIHPDITEPVTVRLYVVSSGKTSEAHQFVYTPVNGAMPSVHVEQPQTQAPFLTKIHWSQSTKQEQDVGMMPPPGTNLVPLSQRRLSSSVEVHSPPMRTLKQELMDENSQNSVLDPSEIRQGRYRHISESSLDVHQGDSNISMINENSIEIIRHNQIIHENSNMSLVNDNSMDIESRQSFTTDLSLLRQNDITDLKVMDLRMKMPMATVADLVNTKAPSMATLQSFGVTESTTLPLPAQSAQSIENFLTNIENKTQPTYLTQQPPILSSASEVSKSEAAAIGEQTNSLVPTQTIESGILPTPITAEKLDALVNCAVDTHISSQKETEVLLSTLPPIINSPLASPQLNASPNLSPEVILNSQLSPSLMCRTQENLLPNAICHTNTNVETNMALSPTVPLPITVTEPEKAILLNAAADLLETQKKINDLQASMPETNNSIINDILTTSNNPLPSLGQLPNAGNNFYTTTSTTNALEIVSKDNKRDFVLPVPMKEMQGQDKKTEDRMIPPSFATMSENELINIINPSCFDQV